MISRKFRKERGEREKQGRLLFALPVPVVSRCREQEGLPDVMRDNVGGMTMRKGIKTT